MKNSVAIILAVFVLVVSFLAFTNTPLVVKTFASIKGGLAITLGPSLKIIGSPIKAIGGLFTNYVNLVNTNKENAVLRSKLDALLMEGRTISDLEKENKRLRELLNFTSKKPGTFIAASVTGEDLKNWFRCIIIDKGKKHGLTPALPVITPKGVVGQAVEVDLLSSKVMIINDPNSSIDVSVDGKNTRGLLEGTGQNVLKLKYVMKNAEIAVGDKLVTSGKDSIFPAGIPAGIVITVDRNVAGIFAEIDVMPFNNFKDLNEVLVLKK